MSAAAVKITLRILIMLLQDEEARKKVIITIAVGISIFLSVITFPMYLLTHPIEAFSTLIENQEQIQLISDFKNQYGDYSSSDNTDVDISGDYVENEIPLFIQWDKRWGMHRYGSGTIGLDGCGTTSLAMVIVGLTGNTSINPIVISDWSYSHGYCVDGVGTSWGLMNKGAEQFGLNSEQISINSYELSQALRDGKVVISSMKPGYFTSTGHFIVLRGITEEGRILINDPNSEKFSRKTWNINIIINESKGMWAFTAKDKVNIDSNMVESK